MPYVRRQNFFGGINQQLDPTKIDPAQDYYLALNARTRRNVVDPVRLPVDITDSLLHAGNIQGVYAAGTYLLVFVDGKAYYRDFSTDIGVWLHIPGFQMSATAPRLYVELIPASTVNYQRKPASATDVSGGVNLLDARTPTKACAIVMDGETQSWVIFADATTRITQSYVQWNQGVATEEYVPIAIMPMFYNGKLYCVGKDAYGKYTQIFHSVTGKPLDFVIPITDTGAKVSALESEGGAPQLAASCSYEEVTCLRQVDAIDGAFLVTTAKTSHLIVPDYTNTLFGEPTFSYQFLFSVGALNNLSVVDLLGDVAVVHYNGIRSFNGAKQYRVEGRNSPFSARINSLIEGIQQTHAATVAFDNYVFFSLLTKHGPGILVYDTLVERFVSLDIYPGVGQIKQFAEVRTATTHKLFFVTTDNRLYQAFASDETATCGLYVNESTPDTASRSQIRISGVTAVFGDVATAGYAQCEVFHDKQVSKPQAQPLAVTSHTPAEYTSIPYDPTLQKAVTSLSYNWTDTTEYSYRAGVMLTWNANAPLIELEVQFAEQLTVAPDVAIARRNTVINPTRIALFGDAHVTGISTTLLDLINKWKPEYIIGAGDWTDGAFAALDTWHMDGKFFSTAGNHDIDKLTQWFPWVAQPPTHYFSKVIGPCEFFFVVDGYNTSDVQVMPYNLDQPLLVDCAQYVWLKSAMESSTARYKIVVWHHPTYTSGVNHSGMVALRAIPIADWGANLLISGHNHQYERLFVNGITHYVVGTGGSPLYDFNATPDPNSITRIKSWGYLRMLAYPLSLVCTFVDTDGAEHDTFIIR